MGEVPGKYYEEDPNGDVYFCDVLSGERITPGELPPSIAQDPLCARGFAFLRERKPSLNLLLAPHGSAEDFQDVVATFAGPLREALLVGIEVPYEPGGHQHPQLQLPLAAPAVFTKQEGFRAFQQAEVYWLSKEKKLGIPCDIDGQPYLLHQELDRVNALTHFTKDMRQRSLFNLAYQYNRQWALVGHFGEWLRALNEHNAPHLFKRTPSLVLGKWHQVMPKRFEEFDVTVEAHQTANDVSPRSHAYGGVVIRSLKNGYISQRDTKVPASF